ncbi:MAG: type IX secretion system membrane protein PorP/SprF [Cytophagales bacterium]|nr:type IX secretion system membrane protein PorP/SprF [Cytophagales bacterium]
MKKILIVLSLLVWGQGWAQDATFSQYYSSSLYLNPAFSGLEPNMTLSSNYRSQWSSIVEPYVTTQVSFIYPLYSDAFKETQAGGLGGSFYTDRAGSGNFRTTGFNVNGGYQLPFGVFTAHKLVLGAQIGVVQKSLDMSNMQWGEQYNPFIGFDVNQTLSEAEIEPSNIYTDISAGLMYYYNMDGIRDRKFNGFIGLSGYHLNRPNESLVESAQSKLPMLYKLHGGVNIPLAKRFFISPNFLYAQQNGLSHLNGGLYLSYLLYDSHSYAALEGSEITLGGWYRNQDAFIFLVGFTHKAYTIGFSYDWNTSSLRYATRGRGAYEISLTLRRLKKHSLTQISTPRI